MTVVSCRALNALSGWSRANTVNWSLFSVSPKSMRIIAVPALSPARTANAM